MALLPRRFDQFWDHPRNRTHRSIRRMLANNRMPRLSIFAGPTASGKTSMAYLVGCASSCPHFDLRTHEGCGECDVCRDILFGKEQSRRHAFFEIDGADRRSSGGSSFLDDIDDAFRATAGYRTSMVNAPDRNAIVFVDEAHRVPPGQLESLLKKTERWCGAHIILATVRPDLLRVTADENEADPLISRADLFWFAYPTEHETIVGLKQAAGRGRLDIDESAAEWIARRHVCCPRDCLGELYRLSNHGNHITMQAIAEEYGPEAVDA